MINEVHALLVTTSSPFSAADHLNSISTFRKKRQHEQFRAWWISCRNISAWRAQVLW